MKNTVTTETLLKALNSNKRSSDQENNITVKNYIGTQLAFISVPNPAMKSIAKDAIKNLGEVLDQFNFWESIWFNTYHYNLMHLSLYYLVQANNKLGKAGYTKQILNWANLIDNWAHSDTLSSIYGKLWRFEPRTIKETILDWNVSENPWLRRQSLVIPVYLAKLNDDNLTAWTLPLIKNLIHDENYFVQKGIGWLLRELDVIEPEVTKRFVRENVLSLTSVAFTTTIEKYAATDKNELKEIRKLSRKR